MDAKGCYLDLEMAAVPVDPRKVRRVKGGFKLDGLSVRGVVPTISSLFYPEYKYADAKQGELKAKPTSIHPVRNTVCVSKV